MSGKYAFTKGLKEVRFLFCQTSDHSAATRFALQHDVQCAYVLRTVYRSFLTRAYPTMKKNNPHTPIMLREALGFEPRVFARYGMFDRTVSGSARILIFWGRTELGKEKQESLSGKWS
jgi:NADH dehydrogenase (ubiquinone) 1 alpha subcomplex subunit 2